MGNKKIQHKTIAITPREQGTDTLLPFFAPPVAGAVGKPHAHFRTKAKESNTNAKMEISMDTIISLLGLFIGGGGGAFFTWRFMRRKAKAEAETAEIDAAKELQDMYQQMLTDAKQDREDRKQQMDELRQERDQYKDERNELRNSIEKLEDSLRKMRSEYQTEKAETDRKIAQLGRKVEAMRPFLCGDMLCKKRQRVAILDGEDAEPAKPEKTTKPRKAKAAEAAEPKEIEPLKSTEL